MALATYQLKDSCGAFPSVHSLWSRGSKLKHWVPACRAVDRKDRSIYLRCRSFSSVGASLALGPKLKPFKISAFKDNQFDDSNGSIINCSKYLKKAVKVSYPKHKSEESSVESSKVENDVTTPQAASVEATTRSLAIQNLFKSWLMLLHAPLQTQAADKILEDSSREKTSETPKTMVKQKGEILKAVWCCILGLDTSIRIPFLVFTPLYLIVNIVYGMEVSKELTPLWIIGPLVVALYVKMFQTLCGLYAYIFKQTVNIIKNLPAYYLLVHDLISHGKLKDGKLKEAMRIHVLQSVAGIKNMNYDEVSRRKIKDLQGWFFERQLDLVEFVWPFYCRTIRFLKSTNLI